MYLFFIVQFLYLLVYSVGFSFEMLMLYVSYFQMTFRIVIIN